MKVRTRFIKSVIKTSQDCAVEMPWARGATRRATIAARLSAAAPKRVQMA